MERTRRAAVLITRAKHIIHTGGDAQEAVQAMDEALALLEKVRGDIARFRDLLAQPLKVQAEPRR